MARAVLDACPDCRRSLPDFGGWPAWCPECGWGLEPDEKPAVPLSSFVRWWRGRTTKAENAELQRLLADPDLLARRHPRRTVIYAAAVGVHLFTLALLAAGVWVITTDIVTVLKIGGGIIAFGLALVTFPLHRLRPARTAKQADAPTLLRVAADVAGVVGAAAPTRVQVTSTAHAQPPSTSPRVLTVDADRWQALDPPGRLALLGHELAHHNRHDARRTPLVTTAAETLDGWLGLLKPDPRRAARRARRVARAGWVGAAPSTAVSISEMLLPVAIAPLYGSVLAVGWVLREGATVAGLRAELYADALAATVADVSGAKTLIDGELAVLVAGGRPPTPLAKVPEIERERRRRVASATDSRVDAMHPTFAARLQLLAVPRPAVQPPIAVGTADMDAMTRELAALRPPQG